MDIINRKEERKERCIQKTRIQKEETRKEKKNEVSLNMSLSPGGNRTPSRKLKWST
jgi:hypothetical protein